MILCCGEALIDMIPAPCAAGQEGFVPHAGGAVFNTAIALGRLGAPSGMLTGLSRDMFGAQLDAALGASGVDRGLLIRSQRPTTLAFVTLTQGQARYHFMDENSAGRMITAQDLPPLPDHVGALFFGGISLACEPCAEAYAALLAREAGRRAVMIDPNIRSGFIRDETRYRARLDAMMAQADIVKLSDEDLEWLIGGDGPLRDKAAQVLDKGPAVVIITRGGAGASGYMRDIEVSVPALAAQIVDTVGAGDTFNAGVLAHLEAQGLLRKGQLRALPEAALEEALRYGARVAAVVVGRAGANPPWASELAAEL
ncbi:MAG: carbohydrate kinase family protein [Paracoccaceae bacterium]